MRYSNSYTMADFRRELRRRGSRTSSKRHTPRHVAVPLPRGRRESRAVFYERLVSSCRMRLAELARLDPGEVIPCPWAQIFAPPECLPGCKCGQAGTVTVGFMVEHYRGVLAEFSEVG